MKSEQPTMDDTRVIETYHAGEGRAGLDALLADDDIEEIICNGSREPLIIIHARHHAMQTDTILGDDIHQFISQAAGCNHKILTEQSPTMDGKLPDGSRINITMPPATPAITFTIRKHGQLKSILDLITEQTISPQLGAFLWTMVEGINSKPMNILIVGGTATGKTTFLNALICCAPKTQRIITIEDTPEIRILHSNRVTLLAREELSMDTLVTNALRMRPDRLIVGEVRGNEASALFTAMNTGHQGCISTLHADSGEEAITRITNPPLNVPKALLHGLDAIIVLKQDTDGTTKRRIIQEIAELDPHDTICLNKIFTYTKGKGTHATSIPSRMRSKLMEAAGIDSKTYDKILEDRTNILEIAARKQLSSMQAFDLLERNKEHWKQYKGKKRMLFFTRQEAELIQW